MLPQRAIDALKSIPRPIQSDTLVFPAPQGGYVNLDNWRERVWKKALKSVGMEHRPLYQCRHTFATLALAAGADLYWVSKQLDTPTSPRLSSTTPGSSQLWTSGT